MKIKNIIVTLLCVIVSQSACAKEFQVINMIDNEEIQVRPYWTGSGYEFMKLFPTPRGIRPAPMRLDPGIHHLKNMEWKDSSGCYNASFEHLTSGLGRFKSMVIKIYSKGQYTVDLGGGESMMHTATGQCY